MKFAFFESARYAAKCNFKGSLNMNFQEWLFVQGKSKATVKHYVGAIYSKLTVFSTQLGLPSLREIEDPVVLDEVIQVIEANPEFVRFNTNGNNMYSAALHRFFEYLSAVDESLMFKKDMQEIQQMAITATEKEILTKARIGQGRYRKGLMDLWNGVCSVTAYPDCQFLIASHIKPWHAATSLERLDPFNGLLLTPNLDKAFDSGFISFDPNKNGRIVFSDALYEPPLLGITEDMHLTHLDSKTAEYLEYHMSKVLLRM